MAPTSHRIILFSIYFSFLKVQGDDGDGRERALRERGSGGRGDCSFDGSEELVLQLLLDVGARLIVREDVAPDGQKLGGS